MRERLLSGCLWFIVFAWSSWFGGTLYQMLVIVPIWSAAPPESVREFFLGTAYNDTIFNFFGPPFMAARVLPVFIALALAWSFPRQRLLLGIASACLAATVIFTLFYVYPINDVLFFQAGGDLSGEEVRALTWTWIWVDRLRFAVGIVAFVAILLAFRRPAVAGTAGDPG